MQIILLKAENAEQAIEKIKTFFQKRDLEYIFCNYFIPSNISHLNMNTTDKQEKLIVRRLYEQITGTKYNEYEFYCKRLIQNDNDIIRQFPDKSKLEYVFKQILQKDENVLSWMTYYLSFFQQLTKYTIVHNLETGENNCLPKDYQNYFAISVYICWTKEWI